MEIVITQDRAEKHKINKYTFKVLAMGAANEKVNVHGDDFQPLYASQTNESAQEDQSLGDSEDFSEVQERTHANEASSASKDALVESLLKKTDEMSSNFIKMQMKLEDKDEEMKVAVEEAKKLAYEEGVQAGISQEQSNGENSYSESLERFGDSVKTLEQSSETFSTALESIKSELLNAALEISKEVVDAEVSEHSSVVALSLSNTLIDELKEASAITLKVNPQDHGPISEQLGSLKHVEIVSDSAIGAGGVVALSDVGNIDSELIKRFERIKRAALSE